ncbi:hypothetical protein NSA02_07960 [Ligilactobacillus murinus]|uniref:hypothetical protein n=1 Tax=Ligilactobacillus murinus TaxID=1622 RepID=UPI00214B0E1C|nr:hypothetical protein [Ligilactobacillus murinus]MCR1896743.1 hypothetical protein [Ligilactobacillus murinus]
MNTAENEFLTWDSGFTAEESEFVVLDPGVCKFTVKNFERKIYDGKSDKIPNGTPYAEIEMEFVGTKGKTSVKERLYLLKRMQWKLTEFFTAIGQNPVIGQTFMPNWNAVIGSFGYAELEVNHYQDNNGNDRSNNRVKKFLKPDAPEIASAQQPAPQQPAPVQTMVQPQPQPQPVQQAPVTPQQTTQPVQPAPVQPQQPAQGGFTPGAF